MPQPWTNCGSRWRSSGAAGRRHHIGLHNHLEKAKALLNTPKRAVAAFEAWRRGWLV